MLHFINTDNNLYLFSALNVFLRFKENINGLRIWREKDQRLEIIDVIRATEDNLRNNSSIWQQIILRKVILKFDKQSNRITPAQRLNHTRHMIVGGQRGQSVSSLLGRLRKSFRPYVGYLTLRDTPARSACQPVSAYGLACPCLQLLLFFL